MKHSLASAVVLAAMLMACNFPWNVLNRDSLRADVAEVLALPDVDPLDLSCQMVGTTRTGYCLLTADSAWVEQIAGALALEYRVASLARAETLPPMLSEGLVGCLASEDFGPVEELPAYWVDGRPPALALGSGGQFEYLLLLHNPATHQVCVQVSYAYG
jgi:hypothetical protein